MRLRPPAYNPIWVSHEVWTASATSASLLSAVVHSTLGEITWVGAGVDDLFVRNSTGNKITLYAATPTRSYMIDGSTLNQGLRQRNDTGGSVHYT